MKYNVKQVVLIPDIHAADRRRAPGTWSNAARRQFFPRRRRALFESFPTDSLVGLRDRALIGVLIYSFARISAALAMRVEDYFPQGKRWWLRLHEKGGKSHEMPVHHTLEGPLLRAALGSVPWSRRNAFEMIRCAFQRWRPAVPGERDHLFQLKATS